MAEGVLRERHSAFETVRKSRAAADAKRQRIEFLEGKLRRKDEVLSELMEEQIKLRKELGES